MQIKAAVAVNSAMLEFYWTLGRDISRKYPGKKRNSGFYAGLSTDLCLGIPDPKGLSPTNIKYARYFHELYSYRQQLLTITNPVLKFHRLWKMSGIQIIVSNLLMIT